MIQRIHKLSLPLLLLAGLTLAGCENQTGEMDAADQKTSVTQKPVVNQTTTSAPASNSDANDSAWSEPQAEAGPDCTNCGTIAAIEPAVVKGEGTGIGIVAGGVVGGIVGNQFGGGSGKKIAAVAGAVGGAFAGHEAEKYARAETYYAVTVNMDSGGTQTVKIANGEALQLGQKVRVDGNNLYVQ